MQKRSSRSKPIKKEQKEQFNKKGAKKEQKGKFNKKRNRKSNSIKRTMKSNSIVSFELLQGSVNFQFFYTFQILRFFSPKKIAGKYVAPRRKTGTTFPLA